MEPVAAIAAHHASRHLPKNKENIDAFYENNTCEFLRALRQFPGRLAGLHKAIAVGLSAATRGTTRGRRMPIAPE